MERVYIAIDLKSFYASVECVERGLDPLTTNLVVADENRTEKTICLAVTPSLKQYGIPGRARLFEVVQKVKEVNSFKNEEEKITYITAPPRMALYMEYSSRIYNIYLKYVAKEDIHVYSVDEVFMDVTHYLGIYKMEPEKLAMTIIKDIFNSTHITATAGIGTNMYLCKVAMDIVAKHIKPDENGVRIATLDENKYRKLLWNHTPLTDFWRVGKGYATKLEKYGLRTMGDIALCSIGKETDFYNEDLLYKLFGVNAELLIDHAWGYEPCTIKDIKDYRPENNSISVGQVLHCAYDYDKARLIIKEMTDDLSLELVKKNLVTNQVVLTIGYDIDNLSKKVDFKYEGEIKEDRYGRKVPKSAHGSKNIGEFTSSTMKLIECALNLFDEIIDKNLLIRRMYVVFNHVKDATMNANENYVQMNLFDLARSEEEKKQEAKEKKIQQALIDIKTRYGKNAVLKGMNLEEGATAKDRNSQIGGHKA